MTGPSRRVVATGGAGFIGGSVVRQLAARGDHVVALVRDPAHPGTLDPSAVELVASDLHDSAALSATMAGADGAIHLAGIYRIGIPVEERPAMLDANVGATERVLDAAIAASVPKIVTATTANVFGNTHGRIVDETFRRDPTEGFLSYYDETKVLAQAAAERRIAAGAPIVIVMPGTTYGPGDHSAVGDQMRMAFMGTAPFIALADVGVSPVHVDDLAAGIIGALDRGRPGEAYVLAGLNMPLARAMRIAAKAGGHRPPRLTIPNPILRIGARPGRTWAGCSGCRRTCARSCRRPMA